MFAEDYDDVGDIPSQPMQTSVNDRDLEDDDNDSAPKHTSNLLDKTNTGHTGCPNKWNTPRVRVCTAERFWGKWAKEPVDKYIRVHNQMIEKFHPPDGWREMYDPAPPGTTTGVLRPTRFLVAPAILEQKSTEAASKIVYSSYGSKSPTTG